MRLFFILLLSTCIISSASASPGLYYSYYEGNWNVMPDFTPLKPIKQGVTTSLNLDLRNRDYQYGFLWQGYIYIPTTGTYTFETSSDDGSKLLISDNNNNLTLLVNNDGVHPNQSRSGSMYLNAGYHAITMGYFQNGGEQVFQVTWASDAGITKSVIPDNAFSTDNTSSAATTTTSSSGVYFTYYEGTWNTIPDFSQLTPVKKGIMPNFTLDQRNRDYQYGLVWQAYIIIPTTGTYTFETNSDDGSTVWVGDNNSSLGMIVNNDGVHPAQVRSGSIYLTAGVHPITIGFFQNGGNQVMEVYWSSVSAGIARTRIPDNVLTTSSAGVSSGGGSGSSSGSGGSGSTGVTGELPGTGGLTGNRNYYFSTTFGDDSRSSTDAQNANTPWKTLTKLNSVFGGLNPGDAVLFKRGDVFDGSINVTKSGASGSPIIFSSYGTGLKPVINGLYTLSNWTSLGNNIWEAYCPSGAKLNMVTLNGIAKAMGRYPNATDTYKGYLTFEGHNGTTSITDNQLSASPNWQGAEVVIRKNNWVIDRNPVTAQSGGTIYYNTATALEPTNGYGYFFQNSPLTLDQQGEWYYDPIQQKLRMYLTGNPSQYDIKAGVVDVLVPIIAKNYISLDNLTFTGSEQDAINIQSGSTDISIQNCIFINNGFNVIESLVCDNITFENNLVNYTNNNAIDFQWCNQVIIRNNVIKNSGTLIGMGKSGNFNYEGISLFDAVNTLVENNEIDSSGYCALMFSGSNVTIKNNFINWFTLIKDDGGGIYTYGDMDRYNRVITGNIIMNGTGASEGTIYTVSTGASGILLDDKTANMDITNNSVANCIRDGVYIHNSRDINVSGNTLFNNTIQLLVVHDEIALDIPIRNMNLTNNILFSKTASQFVMGSETLGDDFTSFGYINTNFYAKPVDQNGINYYKWKDGSGTNHFLYYNLEGWKAKFGFDQNSAPSPISIPSYTVNSTIGTNKYPSGTFNTNTSNVYCSASTCSSSWNNGKLDGGNVQIAYTPNGQSSTDDIATWTDFGAVQAGKTYVISFSLLGSKANTTVTSFILENGGTYSHLNNTLYFTMQNYRTENKFLFTAPITTDHAMLGFFTLGRDGTYWFDNFTVQEANVSLVNPDSFIRFEYNPTSNNKTVALDATYVDVKYNIYSNSVTLAPHTSIVLIKQVAGVNSGVANTAAVSEVSKAPTDAAATEAAVAMRITPNPTTDKVQVFVNGLSGSAKANLAIHSISGATLKTMSLNASTQNVSVDVSAWSKGMYLVTITYDNGSVVSKKFVKN